MTGVDLVVLALRARTAAEQVDHADPVQVLLRERVHRREPHPDLAERLAHRASRDLDEREHERQGHERHQRQRDVDLQHHDDDHGRLDRIRDQRDRALREHLVEALDVVGHPRHQATDGDPIEERCALREHVIEDRDPESVHRALAGELQEPRVAERHHALRDHQADVRERVIRQRVDVAAEDVMRHRVHHDDRLRHLEADAGEHEHDPAAEQREVRSDVLRQPPDQAHVVRLAEYGLGFDAGSPRWRDRGHQPASRMSSSVSSCVR